jgi:iron complex outermembrane receptor protein
MSWASTLSERSPTVPGVLARDRHNFAQDEQISIRGFGTRATFGIRGVRLFLDGVPATMPDGQGQVSHLPLAFARRIEVLRGPFSVLYGNAAGGVVQVFTDAPDGPTRRGGDRASGRHATRRDPVARTGRRDERLARIDARISPPMATARTRRARTRFVHGKLSSRSGARELRSCSNARRAACAGSARARSRAVRGRPAPGRARRTAFDTRKSVRSGSSAWCSNIVRGRHVARAGVRRRTRVEQFLACRWPRRPIRSAAAAWSTCSAVWRPRRALDARRRAFRGRACNGPSAWPGTATPASARLRELRRHARSACAARCAPTRSIASTHSILYAQATWTPRSAGRSPPALRHSRVRFRSDDHYITARNPDDSGACLRRRSPVFGAELARERCAAPLRGVWRRLRDADVQRAAIPRRRRQRLNFALRPARTRSAEVGAKAGRDACAPKWACSARTRRRAHRRHERRRTHDVPERGRRAPRRAWSCRAPCPRRTRGMPSSRYTWLDAAFRRRLPRLHRRAVHASRRAGRRRARASPALPRTTAQAACAGAARAAGMRAWRGVRWAPGAGERFGDERAARTPCSTRASATAFESAMAQGACLPRGRQPGRSPLRRLGDRQRGQSALLRTRAGPRLRRWAWNVRWR